jgi:hypothetical protein
VGFLVSAFGGPAIYEDNGCAGFDRCSGNCRVFVIFCFKDSADKEDPGCYD